jgi:4-hydroxybenzoate polyprenyltransferase
VSQEKKRRRDPNAVLLASLRLMRPADWGLAFAGAALGARLAGGPVHVSVTLGASAIAAVIAGAFVNGDWLHRATRLLAKPHNPLAQGLVRPAEAKWLGFALLGLGLAAASLLGFRPFAAAFFTAALLLLFNYFLDRVFFARNVAAAAVVVLPVVYGWLWAGAAGDPPVVPAAAAALMAVAASVFRDVESWQADEMVGRKTLAASGDRLPVIVAGVAAASAAAIALTPYWLQAYSRRYLALVAAVGGLMVFYTVLNLRRPTPDPLFAASTARMLKFLIFVYFAGLYWETLS